MKSKHILSFFMALALVLGLLPWTALPALAEETGYTVEFSRNDLEYVLPGDSSVTMFEILSALRLTGEA